MESLQLSDIRECETKLCGNPRKSELHPKPKPVRPKIIDHKKKHDVVNQMELIELHTVNTSWFDPIKTQELRYEEMIKKMNEQFIICCHNM